MSDQKPLRLPLVATSTNRFASSDVDSRLVNGFVETNANSEVWCYKRPGFRLDLPVAPALSIPRGLYRWERSGGFDEAYSVFDGTLYRGGVSLGAVAAATRYSFCDYVGASPRMFLHNNFNAYISDGTSVTPIADPDYPAETVFGSVYIDGTTYVMTPAGQIVGSAINDATSWDALNSIVVQIDGGKGVAIAKQQNYLVAFKTTSVEVFYNAQNAAGSPLGRVEAAKLSVGLTEPYSVASIDGSLFWIAASTTGAFKIMRMTGLKADVVSTAAVERLLTFSTISDAIGTGLTVGGHTYYLLHLSTLSLAYDLEEKVWCIWTSRQSAGANRLEVETCFADDLGRVLFQSQFSGGLVECSMSYYTDERTPIRFDLYTPNFDGGTRYRKMVNQMELSADQTVGSVLRCRFSDDDYRTWSDFRAFDLGLERPILQDWGTFRRRAHHFRHEQDLPLRLRYVDLHADLGTL